MRNDEDAAREFGQNIRRLRDKWGWTQPELAERLAEVGVEMRQSTITKLEAGRRPTPVFEVWALASVFGVDYGELLPRPEGVVTQGTGDREFEALVKWRALREARRMVRPMWIAADQGYQDLFGRFREARAEVEGLVGEQRLRSLEHSAADDARVDDGPNLSK